MTGVQTCALPIFEIIKDMHKDEAREREEILRMQENTLADARRRYDRLIDLATTDAIQEDVFKVKSQQLQEEINALERKTQTVNNQSAQWRETLTEIIDTIAHCREVLEGDNVDAKKEIIQALGSKYLVKDGIVSITPHPWLVPIQNNYSDLERQFEEVRSAPQQIRTTLLQAVRISWRRRGDSNSRYRSPRTNDLANRPLQPLGYSSRVSHARAQQQD